MKLTAEQTHRIASAYKSVKTVLRQVEDQSQGEQIVFELSMCTGALETLLLRERKAEVAETEDA